MKVGTAWKIFAEKVSELRKLHVPTGRRRIQKRHNKINREILRAIMSKKRMWKKLRNGLIREEYMKVEKEVRNVIRKAKRRFEKELAAGGDTNKHPYFLTSSRE